MAEADRDSLETESLKCFDVRSHSLVERAPGLGPGMLPYRPR